MATDTNKGQKQRKESVPSIDEWMVGLDFESTESIPIPTKMMDQVIGQDDAVKVSRKAAEQRRHMMLIGDPGTGKSMVARAMAELLPGEELQDILAYNNPEDSNVPRIQAVPAGKGKDIVHVQKVEAQKIKERSAQVVMWIVMGIVFIAVLYVIIYPENITALFFGIMAAAFIMIASKMYMGQKREILNVPKLVVPHQPEDKPPFVDGTGAHAGALLGDVRHDPFQSGGLETPAHERVEAGAIHKAHKGVLFIDEINLLRIESQQSLLTALQEKSFSIMGQSERSSGAMVKTEPVPCDFILVAAGNVDSIEGMHPALRSRIRGYGYEVYINNTMDDTLDNREKLIRFIAQEVIKDGKIPHFDKGAVTEIIREAHRRSGKRSHLTLRLRELGGLIRAAGDVAREKKKPLVTGENVIEAKKMARSLEQQIADRYIEDRKEYRSFLTTGVQVGMVNGLAVMNTQSTMNEYSGIVLPIVAEITPASSRDEGKIIATGKLGEIAKEAVINVSAVIKKFTGKDISNYDVHIQFVGTYEGVEGDSASISIATAVISALEEVPVKQNVAMTGSLSIRGQVLPVGGVSAKIE
ncbi:MAG: ATP-dependent protease LonB, partial [Thermoplasmata archaeon]|nr:ATP-dependent protease LonB [Thermoplasmata archaeon]